MLPALFEKVSDYTEPLLAVSFTDKDGVVYHLVHDIPEEDFNVEIGGQVEIIGWLYQYYNTEPKAKVFARASGTKIKKEEIPAATQLFTPDWIVRYMVENSPGRLWVEGHPNDELKADWKYYLEEAEQEPEVQRQLAEIRKEYALLNPEDLLCIDPCMGSGHILCYFFDVLMQIYESQGYTRRDAVQCILEHNIWGLDVDDRAYQLAYFAVMMKARQYNRRFLSRGLQPHVYAIAESNGFNRVQLKYFGTTLNELEKNNALNQVDGLLEQLYDAKEYGSILSVEDMDWELLREFAGHVAISGQMELDAIGVEKTQERLQRLIDVGEVLAKKYWVACTNPPYMAVSNGSGKIQGYVKKNFPDSKSDLFAVFIERCGQFVGANGYQAMITQHAWMFLSSFEKLRAKLQAVDTVNMAHLGARAFEEIGGEVVQTASFVMRESHIKGYKGVYCRLTEPTTQQGKEDMFLAAEKKYTAQQDNFLKIPGSPVAYWVSKNVMLAFNGKMLGDISELRMGLTTGQNEKYLRLWHEVSVYEIGFSMDRKTAKESQLKWFPYNKGGDFRKWYGNRDYVVNWMNDGYEMRTKLHPDGHRIWAHNFNLEFNFIEHISWNDITTGSISFRYFEKGFLFDAAAATAFIPEDKKYLLLGYLNTNFINTLTKLLNPTIHFKLGDFAKLPYDNWKNPHIEEMVTMNIGISSVD
ncbi:MAG: BREX-1 system adenine-specific DNA-methyltransferase PglX [Blautia sp.]|nr:BREX-1 system adenine-specific DNA-methyltransferase PglX [Blautia sp.]